MTIEDATQEVKTRWREIIPSLLPTAKAKANGETSYICPFCGHGEHGDGLTFDKSSKTKPITTLHCFGSCEFTGSIIDLYAQMNNRNADDGAEFIAMVKDLGGYIGVSVDDTVEAPGGGWKGFNKKTDDAETVEDQIVDPPEAPANVPGKYREFIEAAAAEIDKGAEYLESRGFSLEVAKSNKLGYVAEHRFFDRDTKQWFTSPGIVFPYDDEMSYYSIRSTQGKGFYKPNTDEAGPEPVYRAENLRNGNPVFVVEGQIDALSINISGGNACAIGGAGREKLYATIDGQVGPIILSMDNDPPNEKGHQTGRETQAAIAEELTKRDVFYCEAVYDYSKYSGPAKDANDLLVSNPDQLHKDIRDNMSTAKRRAGRPDNVRDYVETEMHEDISRIKQDAFRKSGFPSLDSGDAAGAIYAGLYVLGGVSSVGKTTFALQLAEQLAAQMEHVIFFSLEQSTLELVTKGLSRRIAANGGTVSSYSIRNGAKGPDIQQAEIDYLSEVGDTLSIVEGGYNCTVSKIADYVRGYAKENDTRPCVFIDYLQILQPDMDPDTKRKESDPRRIVDMNLTALKRLSRELFIPVFVVSSLNRQNYLVPVDFESFKESGGIEYTADTVWGLQMSAVRADIMANPKESLTSKREFMRGERNKFPRDVELVCLKNRHGKTYACEFAYYPSCDYFRDKAEPSAEDNPFLTV